MGFDYSDLIVSFFVLMKNSFWRWRPKRLATLALFVFSLLVLSLSLRGLPGNPEAGEINSDDWVVDGPFELSPERGRFALLYSLAEDHSFEFSLPLAEFAKPDVGIIGDRFVSLFAPGLSLVALPGYLVGKALGVSVLGAFGVVALFAALNVVLIEDISRKLGAGQWASVLGALSFLFATPAFSYGVSFYQHHLTVFLILLAFCLLFDSGSFWKLSLVWLLLAFSVVVDYPNFFLALPIGLLALGKIVKKAGSTLSLSFIRLFSLIFIALPLAVLFWFNDQSYQNPFQLSGTLNRPKEIEAVKVREVDLTQSSLADKEEYLEKRRLLEEKKALNFFLSRNLLNGFYVHLISPDRGVIYFAPVLLLSLLGMVIAYRQKPLILPTLILVMGINLLLYSMWSDPWGGWAFGSRYLIPTYALGSILIAVFLSGFKRRKLALTIFGLLFGAGVSVNALGAITSSRNPPLIEILALEKATRKEEKYTIERNWDYLLNSGSKSFFYRVWGRKALSPVGFYFSLLGLIFGGTLVFNLFLGRRQ